MTTRPDPSELGRLAQPAGLPPGDYVNADHIATTLGVHPQTAQRYFREGGLPGRKIGHNWWTTRDAFDRWLTGTNPTPVSDIFTRTATDSGPDGLGPLETK